MQDDLEKFINQELENLPDWEAPPGLIDAVMAQVHAQRPRPWWKKPLTLWSPGARVTALVLFAVSALGLFSGSYLIGATLDLTGMFSMGWVQTLQVKLQSLSPNSEMLTHTLNQVWQSPWFWAGLLFLGLLYVSLIGVGSFLVRFMARQSRGY